MTRAPRWLWIVSAVAVTLTGAVAAASATTAGDGWMAAWKARTFVERHDRGCVAKPIRGTTTSDPVDARLLAAFSILRRPAGPGDAPLDDGFPGDDGRDEVWGTQYAGANRRLFPGSATDDELLVPVRRTPTQRPVPRRCVVRTVARIRATTTGALRRAALAAERDQASSDRDAARGHGSGLSLSYSYGSGDRSSAALLAVWIRTPDVVAHGMLVAVRGHGRNRTDLVGVIPDGVATVRLTYGRRSQAPGHRTYAAAAERTATVTGNVMRATVPRDARDAEWAHQEWFGPDGRPITEQDSR